MKHFIGYSTLPSSYSALGYLGTQVSRQKANEEAECPIVLMCFLYMQKTLLTKYCATYLPYGMGWGKGESAPEQLCHGILTVGIKAGSRWRSTLLPWNWHNPLHTEKALRLEIGHAKVMATRKTSHGRGTIGRLELGVQKVWWQQCATEGLSSAAPLRKGLWMWKCFDLDSRNEIRLETCLFRVLVERP